jgi:hypothetical protein
MSIQSNYYLPVPDRGTVCGLPIALSEILSTAERAPVAVGVKVTLNVQLESAASEPVQVVADSAKSPAFVPVKLIPEIVTVVLR